MIFVQWLNHWMQRTVAQSAPRNTVKPIPLKSALQGDWIKPNSIKPSFMFPQVLYVAFLPEIWLSCSVDLCPWRRRRARAPANTPPVQAVCCWNPHHALRPAPPLILPVYNALGSVCTSTWQQVIIRCATTYR